MVSCKQSLRMLYAMNYNDAVVYLQILEYWDFECALNIDEKYTGQYISLTFMEVEFAYTRE